MSLREFLKELEKTDRLEIIKKHVDPNLEIARLMVEDQNKTLLFENVKNSEYRVVGGVCCSRENFATAFKLSENRDLLGYISQAIDNLKTPDVVEKAPCQEIVENDVDLSKIPVLTHNSKERGPYITAGVFIARDQEYGTNMSFHRTTPIAKDKLVARICQRDLHTYIDRAGGELPIAICIGLHPSVLLAAGISLGIDVDEMQIANSLSPLQIVKCKTSDVYVPAESEIILEGRITKERYDEGPFVDITGTYDFVRKEPVIEIDCITHRKNPIYQALISSYTEHKLLMGMPKEPVIYNAVNKVCRCKDVILTDGGCSWLHGIASIEKRNDDEGKRAIEAAFNAHKSMKHFVVVDDDIDIHNKNEIEWAIATRFQAENNFVLKKEKGSSLDPSADDDRITSKVGIDATIPFGRKKDKFIKAKIGE